MSLTVIYRLSDNGYTKEKFAFATKRYCLENFLKSFEASSIQLLVDDTNLKPETFAWVKQMHDTNEFGKLFIHSAGSSAGSWREAWDRVNAMALAKSDCVYFVEDDYLHRPGSQKILIEGLAKGEYVSLYDHKDKYIPAAMGGNKYIGEDATEETRVALTESSHWKLTNSTTMTFATSIGTLKEDEAIWKKWTLGSYPHDFNAFIELRQKGRSLITPMPGWSTHCEPKWASPLIDWEKI